MTKRKADGKQSQTARGSRRAAKTKPPPLPKSKQGRKKPPALPKASDVTAPPPALGHSAAPRPSAVPKRVTAPPPLVPAMAAGEDEETINALPSLDHEVEALEDSVPPHFPAAGPTLLKSSLADSRAASADSHGQGHAKTFVEQLQQLRGRESAPERLGRIEFELGRLHEWPLCAPERALEHYMAARERLPDHLPSVHGARRMLERLGRHREALAVYDAELRLTADATHKALLLHRKGVVQLDALGSPTDARQTFEAGLRLAPAHPVLLQALLHCLEQDGASQPLSKLIADYANAVQGDASQRVVLLLQRARLLEQQGDPERAIGIYHNALRIDQRCHTAITALTRLLRAHGRFRELVSVLEQAASYAATEDDQVAALHAVAQIYAQQLDSRPEAVDALERALLLRPADRVLLSEMARLYEADHDHGRLLEVLERLAENTDAPADRLSYFLRMAALCEGPLANEDGAIAWNEAAIELSPAHQRTLRSLERLYRSRQDHQAMLRMWAAAIDACLDPRRRADLFRRMAELLETRFDRPDAAIEHYTRALSIDPDDHLSFRALERLYTSLSRHTDLVALHQGGLDRAQSDLARKANHLRKIGALYEDALNKPEQAINTYRALLRLLPQDEMAIHALQRVAETAERYEVLVEALEMEAALSEDGRRCALLHRTAEVLVRYCDDRDGALRRLREALGFDGNHLPALSSLIQLYLEAGRFEDALEGYEKLLSISEDSAEKCELLLGMSELAEQRIGHADRALELCRRAAETDPKSAVARQRLATLLEASGELSALVELHEAELPRIADPTERALANFRIGMLLERSGASAERALSFCEAAVGYDPQLSLARAAVTRLRERVGDWARLATELEQRGKGLDDPKARARILSRAAELHWQRQDDKAAAARCLEAAFEADPQQLQTVRDLCRLYRELDRPERLGELYAAQAALLAKPDAQRAVLGELARLQTERSPEQARRTLEQALEVAPRDPLLLDALQERLQSEGDAASLRELDHTASSTLDDASTRATHATRYGEALEAEDPDGALQAFRAALQLEAENLGAIRGLSRLAERVGSPAALREAAERESRLAHDIDRATALLLRSAEAGAAASAPVEEVSADLERALAQQPGSVEAAQRLSQVLLENGQVIRLLEALRSAAEAAPLERRAPLWRRIADVQAGLDNLPGAIAALQRALQSSPQDSALRIALSRAYVQDGQYQEAAKLLRYTVENGGDESNHCEAFLELADLYERRFDEPTRALACLRAARALDENRRDTLERLTTLYLREGTFDEAVRSAKDLTERAQSDEQLVAGLLLLAQAQQGANKPAQSAKSLARAVGLQGAHAEAGRAYRGLLRESREFGPYLEALESYVARAPNEDQLQLAQLELARVHADELQDPARACALLEEAVQLSDAGPQSTLRLELARRRRQAGAHGQASAELRAMLANDVSQPEIWRELTETLSAAGDEPAAARATAPLIALGVATAAEKERALAHEPRPANLTAGALDGEVMTALTPELPFAQPALALLRALRPALPKLYPPDLAGYGVGPAERVDESADHPLSQLCGRLARIFGVEPYRLYLHRVRTQGLGLELGDVPSIIVPAHALELPAAQQAYLLAQPLAAITCGLEVMLKLTPREIEILLASAARSVVRDFGNGLTSEDVLNDQAKRLGKALPWRGRKSMEGLARRYAEGPRLDCAQWVGLQLLGFARAALLAADDLPLTVQLVRGVRGREASDLAVPGALPPDETEADLLGFWVSDAADAIRA